MADTKIGLDQINSPAPLPFRRLTNAMILCFLPMATGLVQGLTMSKDARNIWMLVISAIPFLLKGIGMILGNGQVYAPTDEVIDRQNRLTQELKEKNNHQSDNSIIP